MTRMRQLVGLSTVDDYSFLSIVDSRVHQGRVLVPLFSHSLFELFGVVYMRYLFQITLRCRVSRTYPVSVVLVQVVIVLYPPIHRDPSTGARPPYRPRGSW